MAGLCGPKETRGKRSGEGNNHWTAEEEPLVQGSVKWFKVTYHFVFFVFNVYLYSRDQLRDDPHLQ